MIQSLVVNQAAKLPGVGIGWFVRDFGEFKKLGLRQQRAIISKLHGEVFGFPYWNRVLSDLGLKPDPTNYVHDIESAAKYQAGGESPFHLALKRYVSENPLVVSLPRRARPGTLEYRIPSGDSVDVFFSHASTRTAVEVKSRISDRADIVRGLFQCVKYRAVLTAAIAAENSKDVVDAILALEASLPTDLIPLRHLLGVKVVENVQVPALPGSG